jgi:hypothetical protein
MDMIVLADGDVGRICSQFLLDHYRDDLGLLVTTGVNGITDLAN